MIRLFVDFCLSEGSVFPLDDKKTHYLMHVMRLKDGDNILVFNGKDGEYLSEVNMISKKKIELIVKQQTKEQQNSLPLILCPALIKKENMDFVLQKATELGVTKIIPVITQRTVVRNFNLDRANLIVAEASEQCERLDVPVVDNPVELSEIFSLLPLNSRVFFLTERGKSEEFDCKDFVPVFLVGPEGGFSDKEIELLLKQKMVTPIHLGNTILRAETASIAILSCWQYRVFK